jgi:hypothetical protein
MFNEPIRHEYHLLKMPVLLIIGKSDRSVFFRRYASPHAIKPLGNWPALGRQALSRHMMPLITANYALDALLCRLFPVEPAAGVPTDRFPKDVLPSRRKPFAALRSLARPMGRGVAGRYDSTQMAADLRSRVELGSETAPRSCLRQLALQHHMLMKLVSKSTSGCTSTRSLHSLSSSRPFCSTPHMTRRCAT